MILQLCCDTHRHIVHTCRNLNPEASSHLICSTCKRLANTHINCYGALDFSKSHCHAQHPNPHTLLKKQTRGDKGTNNERGRERVQRPNRRLISEGRPNNGCRSTLNAFKRLILNQPETSHTSMHLQCTKLGTPGEARVKMMLAFRSRISCCKELKGNWEPKAWQFQDAWSMLYLVF